ncbi:MAG: T9SS type A sorting domain-containing protein [Flavobacterium sp.]|uniref:T9SS type A sorting domain-containing protein n=1 Tax=Flavobacterium sp. TaxID=239 RepID=UPI0022CB3136|nr:T9SS type A sorting domain-containing protein [Flavobacterium sp.]MCZ8196724.1 T9SS type A sorting domain-containing protein [Flavobacterium sp.]
MKKYYFLIVGFLFFGIVNGQIVDIPDINFKAKLIQDGIDLNEDGQIQVSEANEVLYLLLNFEEIYNLEGIKSFVNLQELYCGGTQLASIDVSGMSNLRVLYCPNNIQLESINLMGLTALQNLDCSYSPILTSLNLDGLVNLTYLNCSDSQLGSLNLSSQSNLQYLFCYFNQLTSLNLDGLVNLIDVDVSSNLLSSISLNGLSNLEFLRCSSNQLSSINLTELVNLKELHCTYNQISSLTLGGLVNLETINSQNNLLSSLNLVGLNNLKKINCDNNQFLSLNINGLLNLEEIHFDNNLLSNLSLINLSSLSGLYLNNNQLTSLDISNLSNLLNVECNTNQLATIELGGLVNLITLECSNNQLTILELEDLEDLVNLECNNNLLININFGEISNLTDLYCQDNQLISLDLKNFKDFDYLVCNNNQLQSLFLKNGKVNANLYFSGNPNIEYLCVDEIELDFIQGKLLSYGYTNCQVNSYCSFVPGGVFYTIQGVDKFDINNDGCNQFDSSYPNMKYDISNGSITGSIFSNFSGNYFIPVQSGTYVITPVIGNSGYYSVFPTSTTVTFPETISPAVRDFCITANGIHNDLEVFVLPINIARPGFDSSYKISYKNKGTNAQSGSINLVYNDAVLDLVSANPALSTQTVNNLSWDFSNLLPFETREILVVLNVNSPTETPSINGGDLLNYIANITAGVDETPLDNISTLNQTVVNSFDPNDKTCLEGATITPSQVGKEVHYMIRFENIGNANAENIVVKDMIDTTKFDVNSLIPISGSHPFVTRITNTNKVEFIFENIQLPFDDANNDGYVAFKIKTKPNLVLGNTFSNTASIYFDYNFPIITNTATTTVLNVLANQDFKFENYILINPNPAKETLNINAQNIEVSSISIFNTLGQLVQVKPNAKETKTIDVSELKSGNYFIKVVSDKGTSSSKFIKE